MTHEHPSFDPDAVERAAAMLPPIEREVLLLSARERLSNVEIAEALGISTKAAERHLAKALYRLSRALEPPRRPWWRFW